MWWILGYFLLGVWDTYSAMKVSNLFEKVLFVVFAIWCVTIAIFRIGNSNRVKK